MDPALAGGERDLRRGRARGHDIKHQSLLDLVPTLTIAGGSGEPLRHRSKMVARFRFTS